MKKVLLLAFVSLLGMSAFAQGDIKNETHFTLSWDRPVRNFGEVDGFNTDENRYQYYMNNVPGAEHMGGALDAGMIAYIHPTEVFDGFKLGILVDFIDLSANYFRFTDTTTKPTSVATTSGTVYVEEFDSEMSATDLNVRYSVNIGLVATYSPMKNLYFDFFGKIRPSFGAHYYKYARVTYEDWDKETKTQPYSKSAEDTGIGFGLGSSFGMNVRYSKFIVGAELISGSLNYKYDNIVESQKEFDHHLKVKFGVFFAE